MSGEAQSDLDGREVRLATLFQVHQALDDAAQEGSLLRLRLILGGNCPVNPSSI